MHAQNTKMLAYRDDGTNNVNISCVYKCFGKQFEYEQIWTNLNNLFCIVFFFFCFVFVFYSKFQNRTPCRNDHNLIVPVFKERNKERIAFAIDCFACFNYFSEIIGFGHTIIYISFFSIIKNVVFFTFDLVFYLSIFIGNSYPADS